METQLEAINRQIQQEKERHNRVINDLTQKKNQENILYQQKITQLNSRKEQIKKSTKLEHMEKTIDKAMAGLE